jgi:hypothetical protein
VALYYITVTSRYADFGKSLADTRFFEKKIPLVHKYKPHEVRFWAARFFSGPKIRASQGLAVESIRTIFQFLIVLQTTVYTAERFVIQWNFFDLKNPRFIIESGFKSRAVSNQERVIMARVWYLKVGYNLPNCYQKFSYSAVYQKIPKSL